MKISVDRDMMFDLAKAVHAGSLDKAKDILSLMTASGGEGLADLLMKARREVVPLPTSEPLPRAIPLPAPGADPNHHFGGIAKYRRARAT